MSTVAEFARRRFFFVVFSSGILENMDDDEMTESGEVDEEGNPLNLDDLGDTSGNHKLTQLNGPVIDPTFTGRDNQQSARIPFVKKKTVNKLYDCLGLGL